MKAFDAEQVSIHGVKDASEGPELEQIGISSSAQNNHITPGKRHKMYILGFCLILTYPISYIAVLVLSHRI